MQRICWSSTHVAFPTKKFRVRPNFQYDTKRLDYRNIETNRLTMNFTKRSPYLITLNVLTFFLLIIVQLFDNKLLVLTISGYSFNITQPFLNNFYFYLIMAYIFFFTFSFTSLNQFLKLSPFFLILAYFGNKAVSSRTRANL